MDLSPALAIFFAEMLRDGIGWAVTSVQAATVIAKRPVTFWMEYEWLIIPVMALCIVEAVLIGILLKERQRRRLAQGELEERLRFEKTVSELSSAFLNLPVHKVSDQIIEALGRVANLLRFDIAALSVFSDPGPVGRVAYIWRAKGVPEIPSTLTDRDFPWVARELFAGRDVSLSNLNGLPPEAHIDRATYEQYHVRSTHNVPMVCCGKVIGVLGLCTVWEEREMSPGLLQSQRLLGEVFANALARQMTEQVLRESENRFRVMADSAPVMIWMSGPNKRCEYFNKQWLNFTGRTLEQELGNGWTAGVHPEDLDHCLEIYNRAFEARRDFVMEYRLRRRDGKYGWIVDHGAPRIAQDGTFLGYVGSCMDVTERARVEAEVRRNREELAHVGRISMMGELAASLAHELNQPLTAILSNAQAAQRFMAAASPDLHEVKEILKDIVHDNNRAGEVIRRIRSLVKKENLEFEQVDMASTVREVVALVHSDVILHGVRISLDLSPDLRPVQGDKIQLQQVMLNLLLNAFDAMKDCSLDEREVLVRLASEGAGMIRTSVNDRGTGLGPGELEKIFEPFFTTKSAGMGMGLSISRSIIEAHGGRLWAETHDGQGATFCFTVPMAMEAEMGKMGMME